MNLEEFNRAVFPMQNKLYRFALSMVANNELAEDIVQEAFLKLWKTRESLHEILNLEAWSMRMVKNLCLDHFKSKYRKTMLFETKYEQASVEVTPQKQTEITDTMQQINLILETLPNQQAQIIRLRDMEGYSYKEIAEVLEIDINVVKVNLHRARKAVKVALEKKESYGL